MLADGFAREVLVDSHSSHWLFAELESSPSVHVLVFMLFLFLHQLVFDSFHIDSLLHVLDEIAAADVGLEPIDYRAGALDVSMHQVLVVLVLFALLIERIL